MLQCWSPCLRAGFGDATVVQAPLAAMPGCEAEVGSGLEAGGNSGFAPGCPAGSGQVTDEVGLRLITLSGTRK